MNKYTKITVEPLGLLSNKGGFSIRSLEWLMYSDLITPSPLFSQFSLSGSKKAPSYFLADDTFLLQGFKFE